eukprot:jgi/Mesvir1/9813/Mv15210-RA.1
MLSCICRTPFMDSHEAWGLVVECLDMDDLMNAEAAFENTDIRDVMNEEIERRKANVRTALGGSVDAIRQDLVACRSAIGSIEAFKTKAAMYFDSTAQKRVGPRVEDLSYVDMIITSCATDKAIEAFTSMHLSAGKTLLGIEAAERCPERSRQMPSLTRLACMIVEADSNTRFTRMAWLFLDAMGLEEGSFVFFIIMLVLRCARFNTYIRAGLDMTSPISVLAYVCHYPRFRLKKDALAAIVAEGRADVNNARKSNFSADTARMLMKKHGVYMIMRRAARLDYQGIRTGDFARLEEWKAEMRAELEEAMGKYESNLRLVRDSMLQKVPAKMVNASLTVDPKIWAIVMRSYHALSGHERF